MESTTIDPLTTIGLVYRVMIVEDDTLVAMGLKSQLEKLGHCVVAQASTAIEAETKFRQHSPELVLVDIKLDEADGLELSSRLLAIRACPIIVVSAFSDKQLIDRATAAGVYGYLIKPVLPPALVAQMEIAVARFREHMIVVAQNQTLTQNLENRKVIEKAKGVLMRRLSLSEPEAHKRLQSESQKRRVNLADLAKKIIESEELLGGF